MQLSARVLGTSIVHALQERTGAYVLKIGADKFRRGDLAGVGCFNFIAAAHLSIAVAAIGGVKSTRDLFDTVPPSAFVLPGVGSISLAVLGAAFEAKGVGGDQPLENWMAKHRGPDVSRDFVTFDTLKHQEREREPGERRARKARADRKHARRGTAHRLRVERFTTRQGRAKHETH